MPIGTPVPLTLTIIMLPRRFPRLGLGPWRHAAPPHRTQGPDVIRQSRGYGGRPRLPALGRARAVRRQRLAQRRAYAGLRYAEIIVHMIHAQLLTHAVLALAERRDASADRGDMLADAEVDPLYEGRVDLPAQQGQNRLDRLQGAKYHAVLHVDQAPTPHRLDHRRGEPRGQRH